jgi:alkaline phosphatase D
MIPAFNRRQWLRLVGAGATGALFSCRDTPRDASAIVEPSQDALTVVVWSAAARTASIEIRTGGALVGTASLPLVSGIPNAIDVTNLDADSNYEVTVHAATTHVHQVRTAPRDDDPRPVRLAVAADFDPNQHFAPDPIAGIVGEAPEVLITIGDFPYTDDGPHVATTVPDYRARYASLRTDPRMQALQETVAFRAIYDDHEFRDNWTSVTAMQEPDRFGAAMQVWDEFFPVRGATGDIRYRSWRWGANVECFLLDTRRFRSADDAPDDANKTMLGAVQRDWLLSGLAASTATFKLIFTTIPLDYGNGNDDWSSFSTERDAIFAALLAMQVPGLLFVSGDQHWFASHCHAYSIREFQIGPLVRGLGNPPAPVPGVLYRSVQLNAGIIDIAADRLTFSGVGGDGSRFFSETLTAADLTPRATSALPWPGGIGQDLSGRVRRASDDR